ncbi:MAG: replicative DNA helicase [Treponema sp.]|jgi:replicative DNA helicase|nr:replicative DNA helicase [Treponema sp.]
MAQSRDKTPPHDDELERATLGSMLQDAEAVDAAIQQHLAAGDFYARANQRIYEAVLSLDEKGLRADIQTVVQELKQLGKLEEAGGAAYVSSLTTVIPSGANIDYYAQSVRNYSLRRALLKVAFEIGVKVYDESKESREVLEEVQQSIFDLSDSRQVFSFRKIGEVLQETIDIIDKVYKSKQPLTGIPTGFEKLDQMTSGFQPSDFIVIGARPSVGKTALALNIASYIACTRKVPLAFFSLEMSEIALTQRLISSEATVEGNKLRSGFLTPGDFKKILDVAGKMYEAPFYIVDMPNMKLLDLRSQARKLRAQQQIEIVFVDYLGLIGHENNSLPRYEQISEISRSLKSLARELSIPVVVLCQLNREAQWETPSLANLRDSGSIEQDADLVLFLHREAKKKRDKEKEEEEQIPSDVIPTDLIVAKQRNGPVGNVKLELQSKFARFFPLSREHS